MKANELISQNVTVTFFEKNFNFEMLTRIYVVDTAYYTFSAMKELLDGTQVYQIF